jgi:hypothetical protein
MIGGSPQRFVVRDESADTPLVYQPSSGSFEKSLVRPARTGERRIKPKTGQENFLSAGFAALAASYSATRWQAITWVSGEKVRQAAHLLAAIREKNDCGQYRTAVIPQPDSGCVEAMRETEHGISILHQIFG